jgi:hypothetical protein
LFHLEKWFCFLFTEYPGKQDFLQFAEIWPARECLQETGHSPYNLPVIFGRAWGGLSCFRERQEIQAIGQDEQDLQESCTKAAERQEDVRHTSVCRWSRFNQSTTN